MWIIFVVGLAHAGDQRCPPRNHANKLRSTTSIAGEHLLPSEERCRSAVAAAAANRASTLLLGRYHAYGDTMRAYDDCGSRQLSYVAVPKAGSSFLKALIGRPRTCAFGEMQCPTGKAPPPFVVPRRGLVHRGVGTTYISIIRDPLERFVSAFYEMHHRGRAKLPWARSWAAVGTAPNHENATVEAVVLQLEALVRWLEVSRDPDSWMVEDNREYVTWMDEHLTAQTVFLLRKHQRVLTLPIDSILLHPHEYSRVAGVRVGRLADIETFLAALVQQEPGFGEFLPSLQMTSSSPISHNARSSRTALAGFSPNLVNINTSHLPPALARRVCALYRVDYCCLGLSIPPVCQPLSHC